MTRDTVGYAYPPDPPESDDRCASCECRDGDLTVWPFDNGNLCSTCAEDCAVEWLQSDAVQAALTALAALDAETVRRVANLFGEELSDDGDSAVAVASGLGYALLVAQDYAPKPKEGGL